MKLQFLFFHEQLRAIIYIEKKNASIRKKIKWANPVLFYVIYYSIQ